MIIQEMTSNVANLKDLELVKEEKRVISFTFLFVLRSDEMEHVQGARAVPIDTLEGIVHFGWEVFVETPSDMNVPKEITIVEKRDFYKVQIKIRKEREIRVIVAMSPLMTC